MSGRERNSGRPVLEQLWRRGLPWYQLPLWASLAPASILYSSAMAARAACWRLPGLRRRAKGVRVISVGNLTVGGNNKTPFTLYLARKLLARGLAAGIVSRGYGGSRGGGRASLVSDGREVKLTPREAGDEPVMMAKSFAGPVAIAERRYDGVRMLAELGPLDVVVLDDAFQHLRMRRDVDLLLVNFERGFGNGWTLPAGPMRERLGAARRADAVVLLSSSHGEENGLAPAQAAELKRKTLLGGVIRPQCLVQPELGVWRELPFGPLSSRRVLAVSGLADASSFYRMLRELDTELVGVLEYPDHHDYSNADWQSIMRAAGNADMVVTTEKDLVKLERFPFARDSLYALRLEVSMGENEQRLLELVMGAADSEPLVVTA